MTPGSKLVADHAEHRAESPRVAPALEPLQYPLASADRLVRALDAVLLASPAQMRHGRQHDGFRRRIACQSIGHDGVRDHPESLQRLSKGPRGGTSASAALDQDVEYLSRSRSPRRKKQRWSPRGAKDCYSDARAVRWQSEYKRRDSSDHHSWSRRRHRQRTRQAFRGEEPAIPPGWPQSKGDAGRDRNPRGRSDG
jgi:hypothetical protein